MLECKVKPTRETKKKGFKDNKDESKKINKIFYVYVREKKKGKTRRWALHGTVSRKGLKKQNSYSESKANCQQCITIMTTHTHQIENNFPKLENLFFTSFKK